MIKMIETFSGIGSQVQALKNLGVAHQVVATVEWEIGAIYTYDIIHNGPQNLQDYRHHTKGSILEYLKNHSLSGNGEDRLNQRSLKSLTTGQIKALLYAIERNNNLCDIKSVDAGQLPKADILTYSFPCQDLSVSGHWHNQTTGINRNANNRSTLLWEIERILLEYRKISKPLPTFLLMENVSNIMSAKHIDNFMEWLKFLENLGYVNQIYTLDARNFGVPQSRIRTYVISVLSNCDEDREDIISYFTLNSLENRVLDPDKKTQLQNYLRLNYENEIYRKEAIESTPSLTKSREKIFKNNVILATDRKVHDNQFARTVTTKQDRHPNSGIIQFKNEFLVQRNTLYRNLTPRECFLLMGFDEKQYDMLMRENFQVNRQRNFLTNSKLIQLAGNSIVVPVLEEIFSQIIEINDTIIKGNKELV